jgi:hypothetical protein
LTKLLQPDTLKTVHEKPPLKRVGKWVLTPYLLAGGFFFGKTNTLSLIYNVDAEIAWGRRGVDIDAEIGDDHNYERAEMDRKGKRERDVGSETSY